MPSLLPSCSLLPPSPDLAEGDINTLHNIYIRQVLFTLQHLLGFEFLRHKRPELDIPLRCCDTVTGERESIKRTSQHPRRLLMASLEIREDLFYEYVVIWGRGRLPSPRDLRSSSL